MTYLIPIIVVLAFLIVVLGVFSKDILESADDLRGVPEYLFAVLVYVAIFTYFFLRHSLPLAIAILLAAWVAYIAIPNHGIPFYGMVIGVCCTVFLANAFVKCSKTAANKAWGFILKMEGKTRH